MRRGRGWQLALLAASFLLALLATALPVHARTLQRLTTRASLKDIPSTVKPTRYWVTLTDKAGVSFRPARYFSPEAQARRVRQHLPAFDYTDLPVRTDYVARLRPLCDTIALVSRWFNAVSCRATPAQAAALRALPFVRNVQAWPATQLEVTAKAASRINPTRTLALPRRLPTTGEPSVIDANDYLLARRQTASLGSRALNRAHLDGHGLRIAIFDVGFNAVDRHPAFAELIREQRIVATHDFLKNRDDVFRGGSHGTEVLGCLAGRLPGGAGAPFLGLAPAASYLLARTEQLSQERYAEEEAWLAAAEWADKNGADLISSSLAYTEQRYFPEQMDGRQSLVARAAELAVRKGMLVVSAAGNDGEDEWVRIGTPADGDSVLAVGGLDPATGLHVAFSSVGPSADRRIKPDVAAFGIVLTAVPSGLGYERLEGTSFSAPLVAGLAACVWQQQRDLTAVQLLNLLRRAGSLYPYYDYAHGYGRPLVERLLSTSAAASSPEPTFDFVVHDTLVAVVLRPAPTARPHSPLPLLADEDADPAGLLVGLPADGESATATPRLPGTAAPVGREKPVPAASGADLPYPDYPMYLYWHLADGRGVLHRYEVRAVSQRLVVQLPRRLLRGGDIWRVHFLGYTGSYSE
jgi:serine protease AprX